MCFLLFLPRCGTGTKPSLPHAGKRQSVFRKLTQKAEEMPPPYFPISRKPHYNSRNESQMPSTFPHFVRKRPSCSPASADRMHLKPHPASTATTSSPTLPHFSHTAATQQYVLPPFYAQTRIYCAVFSYRLIAIHIHILTDCTYLTNSVHNLLPIT